VAVALATQAARSGAAIEAGSFLRRVWELVEHVHPEDNLFSVVSDMLASSGPDVAISLVPQPPLDYKARPVLARLVHAPLGTH